MVKTIQEFLNFALKNKIEPLTTDGISGHKTQAAINIFIDSLKSTYDRLGYKWSTDYNLVGYRTDNTYTDAFSDYLILQTKGTIMVWNFSTKPGRSSVMKNIALWVQGRNGVAVLKEGQYLKMWTIQSGWWSGRPFLFQTGTCDIYRDPNTDGLINREVIQSGLFGINGHTWIGFSANFVGNLSEGCQVAKEVDWLNFLGILSDADGVVDYTLLNHEQFTGVKGKY